MAYHSKIFQKKGHPFTPLSDSLIKKKLTNAIRRRKLPKNGLDDKEKVLDSITDFEYSEVDRFIESDGAQPVILVRTSRPASSARLASRERSARLETMRNNISSSQ